MQGLKEQAKEAHEWTAVVLELYRTIVRFEYEFVEQMLQGKEHVKILDAKSIIDWAAQHGMMTRLIKLGRRVVRDLEDWLPAMHQAAVSLEVLDIFRRMVPRDEYDCHIMKWKEELVNRCSPSSLNPSIPDFIAELRGAYPSSRKQKVTIVRGEGLKIDAREVNDVSEVFGEGVVIRGWPISE